MAKDIGWPRMYTVMHVNTCKHRKMNRINGALMAPVAPCEIRNRKCNNVSQVNIYNDETTRSLDRKNQ